MSVEAQVPAAHDVRLAAAVAASSRALLLDASNRPDGWLPLSEAIASGRAYAVEVAPHLLALDADTVDGRYLSLAQALSDAGAPTVEVTSGGAGGRRHLWLSLSDDVSAPLRSAVEDAARARGVDVRAGARLIRPPLSPHRSGARGVLLTPATIEEACARLQAQGVTAAHLEDALGRLRARTGHAQGTAHPAARPLTSPSSAPLPPALDALMRQGDTAAAYRSTSEALWTLALALANRGTPTEEAVALLAASPLWQASSKAQRASGLAWLAQDYGRALERVASRPRLASRPDAQHLLSRLERAAALWRWPRNLGSRPLSLAKACAGVLKIARTAGVIDGVSVSVRSLSLASSLSSGAAHRALRILTAEGVLEVTERAQGEDAARYRIALEHPLWQSATDATAGDGAQPDADAWRGRGALGGAAWRVLLLLEVEGALSAEDLAGTYGAGRRHIRKVLRRLASAGLIRRDGSRWEAVEREERRRILAHLDTGGVALRREAYLLQRRGWSKFVAERSAAKAKALEARIAASEAAGAAEVARWEAEVEARSRAYGMLEEAVA